MPSPNSIFVFFNKRNRLYHKSSMWLVLALFMVILLMMGRTRSADLKFKLNYFRPSRQQGLSSRSEDRMHLLLPVEKLNYIRVCDNLDIL